MKFHRRINRVGIFLNLLALILVSCSGKAAGIPTPVIELQPTITVTSTERDILPTEVRTNPDGIQAPEGTQPEPTKLPDEMTVESGNFYNGIPHGYSEDGFPSLGSSEAPVTLIDYSDFL